LPNTDKVTSIGGPENSNVPNTGPTGAYGDNISGSIKNQERETKPATNGSDRRFENLNPANAPKPKSSSVSKADAAETTRLIGITRDRIISGDFSSPAQRQRLVDINVARITGNRVGYAAGGMVSRYMASGGMVPKYMAEGGKLMKPMGTDKVPAMLTPGEFVIKKSSVNSYGVENLKSINNGQAPDSNSVYNYSLTVNTKSGSNPDDIARTVMTSLKRVESQRIRSSRY
jgi:hypothetical protein